MRKINSRLYIHAYNPTSAVAISFGKDGSNAMDGLSYTDERGKPKPTSGEYVPRSKTDDRLLRMHRISTESPNKWQLIKTKASIIAGDSFRVFDREIVNKKETFVPTFSPVFDEWSERLELMDYLQAAAYQLSFSDELNVKISLGTDKKVLSLEVIDNNDIRCEKLPKGKAKIERFWISEKFGYQKSVRKEDCLVLPAFDPNEPTKFPVSVIHVIAKIPSQKFYGLGTWWGSDQWAIVTNNVPKFYDAAFRNGFFITHQISIPDDYWDKDGLTDEEKEAEKEITLNEIVEALAGVDEANKIIFTFSQVSQDGKGILKEIKITPLSNPIKDDAFIKMFEASNRVQAASHGVPGTLAGIDLGNGLGTSGKEIIAVANYTQDYQTLFDREMICKAVRIAKKIDGIEPDKYLGIKRIESYTADSTPKNDPANPN
jgi:hypothetical protein